MLGVNHGWSKLLRPAAVFPFTIRINEKLNGSSTTRPDLALRAFQARLISQVLASICGRDATWDLGYELAGA